MKQIKFLIASLAIAIVVVSSGCVTEHHTASNGVLTFEMSANMHEIPSGSTETFYDDIENPESKTFKNIVFKVFDAPFFDGTCEKKMNTLLPKASVSLSCSLKSQNVDKDVTSRVAMSTEFDGTESVYQQIKTISQEEYENHRIPEENNKYTYTDGYVKVDVDLSRQPIVFVQGKKYYMNVKVENDGPGTIEHMDITISKNGIIGKCNPEPSSTTDNEYMFSCEINPPSTKVLNVAGTIIKVDYRYKVITTDVVKIMR